MVLKIEYSQKISTPEIPEYYYSRETLLKKISSYKSKRLILITAPAGYGKTSFSAEYYHKLKKDLKLWISISLYDNSIENFFLLLAIAFEKNFKDPKFGKNLKKVLSGSQNISLQEKINNVISSFSNDLFIYLNKRKKRLHIFLDDFHNIEESEEVSSAINYFLDYLPPNINFIFISRRDPIKINYPKFLAKNWLGRITKEDLSFTESDTRNFLKTHKSKVEKFDKILVEEFLKTTEGWVTAIRLFLMTDDHDLLRKENHNFSRKEIFEYFTNEIYKDFSEDEKLILLKLSFTESFDENIIENVLKLKSGFQLLLKLYEKNAFINREEGTFKFHELLRKFLNKIALEIFPEKEIRKIYNQLGKYYLKNKDWRDDYIALNYLIKGKDYETLKSWIKLNASDKLLLIHSSGLYLTIEEISNIEFKNSLEYILLKINTLIFKEKNIEKPLSYLKNIIYSNYSPGKNKKYLIPVKKIMPENVNYYIELLMLICNCNFYKDGIGYANIEVSEHILKFNLKTEQEIQFIVSLIKSYITTGENSKSKKYIKRLQEVFISISGNNNFKSSKENENSLVESIFSLLIFFDYGDYKTGNKIVKYILESIDLKNYDLSNYSQLCFALFTSYNLPDFKNIFNLLEKKNNEKSNTIFSAYKNQYEFQSILNKFLNYEFKEVINELEYLRKNTFQKNYIYFIDSLILYCYNLIEDGKTVIRMLKENSMSISGTRKLILTLEASLLINDQSLYKNTMNDINIMKKENFTLFNQALIYFCECYKHFLKKELLQFRSKYLKFLRLCEEYEYDEYIKFRYKANKLRQVFNYAAENNITNHYIEKIIPLNILFKNISKITLNISIEFLNGNRIFIEDKELEDAQWQRPKSKSVFLYMIYKAKNNISINKGNIIDDILYTNKEADYIAIADVEISKVRRTLQVFLSDLFPDAVDKDILIVRGRNYLLTSKNITLNIKTDIDQFKFLSSSKSIADNYSAIDMYKSDFAEGLYQNWAEDIRENLRFIYSETLHKLISHTESKNDSEMLKNLLERLAETDYSDDEIMMRLLSIYAAEKNYRKFKQIFKIHEKRLNKEFNAQPSEELKKLFKVLFPLSLKFKQ